MANTRSQFARWCFTLNNYIVDTDYIKLFNDSGIIKLLVIGYETGEGGTRHLQGYLEYKRSYGLSKCKLILHGAHYLLCTGTRIVITSIKAGGHKSCLLRLAV